MARQLFDTTLFTLLSAAGALGVGYKLAFYTGSSTTPITTYNARTAGSANANPVVADSNGRLGQIWIEESQTIKWVLKTAADVTVVTVDDVLLSAAAPTVAAGLLTFLAGSAALPIANGGTASTSAAAAIAALGGLALAGGTMTGNIVRSGKGCHVYFNDAAMTTPKVYITASASADPRAGVPGEIWLKY